MSRADIRYERPSRFSRVIVVVCALAVGFLAVWVLAPIMLAHLDPTSGAAQQPRETASTGISSRVAKDLIIPTQPSAPPAPLQAADPSGPATTTAAATEPVVPAAEPPAAPAAVAAVGPSALSISGEAPAPAPASAIPWPVASADDPAADTSPSTGPGNLGPVPLPRKRPNLTAAAHVAGIPLPRPRPETAPTESPAADQTGEDALFDRIRHE
jgi:hypothetical protein